MPNRLLFLTTPLLVSACCLAQPTVVLTTLADSDTPVPDGPGTLERFELPYIETSGRAGFRAFGPDREGLYAASTPTDLVAVVDTTDTIPGFGDRFSTLVPGHADNGETIFIGTRRKVLDIARQEIRIQRGVYVADATGIREIVRTFDAIAPGANSVFTDLATPTIDDGDIAFVAWTASERMGLYATIDGTLRRVVGTDDPVPGALTTFQNVANPYFEDGLIAFWGGDLDRQRAGIYLTPGTGGVETLTIAADTTTQQPDNGATFTGFNDPTVRNGIVTFEAYNRPDPRGLYQSSAGALTELTDSRTNVPGTTDRFFHYGQASTVGDRTVFYGLDRNEGAGVFLLDDTGIHPLLQTGDALDDGIVADAQVSVRGFNGDSVAMRVRYDDEREAIVLAELIDGAIGGCACDLSGDGEIAADDLLLYLDSWFDAATPGPISELLSFLDCWLAGCDR